MLPDDVLLEIFNSHGYHERYNDAVGDQRERAWQTLVHVCRRWRRIVFGFPRHLNLQLVCTTTTQARDMLDVWPALPIIVSYSDHPTRNVDNIFAALAECRDRVCQIFSSILRRLEWDIYWAIQQPFPELRYMTLVSANERMGVLPDSFLGGSAPRLETLVLYGIPFLGLPKLLLSSTHLVDLRLHIPHSGYVSPDGMVAALSASTSLKSLILIFESPRSRPDPTSRRPPPSTRSVLPVLTFFCFRGVSEYLDDLVACIDAPQLDTFSVTFFNGIVFDTPQLVRFISHTPKWKAFEKVFIDLRDDVTVDFSSQTSRNGEFTVAVLCYGLNRRVSSLEQLCTSFLPLFSILEDLYFYMGYHPDRNASVENRQWLELLRPVMAVKNLYLSEKFASRIAPALQELVEGRTTDVFPALQNIFLEGLEPRGSVQEGIRQFVAARQVANHPISISSWTDSEEDED